MLATCPTHRGLQTCQVLVAVASRFTDWGLWYVPIQN